MPNRSSRSHLGDLVDLPIVAAPEFTDWRRTRHRKEHRHAEVSPAHGSAADEADAPGPQSSLSAAELRFLKAVCHHPGEPSSTYAKLARMAPRKAAAIRASLCERGYVREHTVNLKSRGRPSIVIEPLARACAIFPKPDATTNGGNA